ncbi:MAG: hypothetical protein ETSY1_00825 [Candidatus Entotheonella factor]|uniref:Uncharacterized protein n=1 Tax=Entotheonella factor TaxID=1429438 RepID=W4LZB9_ENTF1|nr:hypothetical protein [Candidatus Entotheonella palauensis]ETX03248.1 MAG: hypothetical protein ETSY1_00825 [Candidatus Entotheonella factor]
MRYEVTTSWTPEEVLEYALDYFGPGQTGLEVTSRTAQGIVLQGGGGYVAVQIQAAANTTVDIETREWDYPVHQFMARIGRRRWWSNWWRRRSKTPETTSQAPTSGTVDHQPIFTILNNRDQNLS